MSATLCYQSPVAWPHLTPGGEGSHKSRRLGRYSALLTAWSTHRPAVVSTESSMPFHFLSFKWTTSAAQQQQQSGGENIGSGRSKPNQPPAGQGKHYVSCSAIPPPRSGDTYSSPHFTSSPAAKCGVTTEDWPHQSTSSRAGKTLCILLRSPTARQW